MLYNNNKKKMPKKQINSLELLNNYLEKADNIADATKKTYRTIGNNLSFNVLTTQPNVLRKLKGLHSNPNTLSQYLNLIIILRKDNKEPYDSLIKYRNQLREEIIKMRREKLDTIKTDLPPLKYLDEKLEKLTGLPYIYNYLFVTHGVRNKDVNLVFVDELPEDGKGNYVQLKRGSAVLDISDYKTGKQYGRKTIKIKEPKFIKELKKLKLNVGEYLLARKDGGKLGTSAFNERVMNLSIDGLGEAKIFKILVTNLLDTDDFEALEELVKSRGTSLSTIMKSYNLNNTEAKKKGEKLDVKLTKNVAEDSSSE